MAYSTPSISASSQSFATLQTLGFRGYVQGLVAAQSSPTAESVELTNKLLHRIQACQVADRAASVVSDYLQGDPIAIATEDLNLKDLCFAFKAVVTAIDEIGALVDANQGTLAYTTGDPIFTKYRRRFP